MSDEPIDWLNGKPAAAIQQHIRWQEAIEQADNGSSTSLVDMLRSSEPIGPEARTYLADLLERRPLFRKPGRQQTPAYRTTLAEARVTILGKHVRALMRDGIEKDEAIRSALRDEMRGKRDVLMSDDELDEKIPESDIDLVENFLNGRRGSSNRKRKRDARP
jgi:hypothetical protein